MVNVAGPRTCLRTPWWSIRNVQVKASTPAARPTHALCRVKLASTLAVRPIRSRAHRTAKHRRRRIKAVLLPARVSFGDILTYRLLVVFGCLILLQNVFGYWFRLGIHLRYPWGAVLVNAIVFPVDVHSPQDLPRGGVD